MLCRGLKFHLDSSSTYDGLKYNFKMGKISDEKFEKHATFHKTVSLANRCKTQATARRYVTSNVLEGCTNVFTFNDTNYKLWLGRMQKINYHVTNEIKSIVDDFDDLFVIRDDGYPLIISKLYEKRISLETVTCINMITGFINKVEINDVLLWPETKYIVQQYTPLFIMDVDQKKIRHHLVNTFK